MKANEFVKKYGWDMAKLYANGWITFNDGCVENDVSRESVKQFVDAWELVEKRGGLSEAKAVEQQYWNSGVGAAMIVAMGLKQAILDVESCQ